MARFVLLIKYTEIGISQIHNTVGRAAEFRADAAALGVAVESVYWTLGEFDGVLTLTAADPAAVIALTTHLARKGFVRTCLLPAYTQDEFGAILAKMPAGPADD